MDGITNDFSFDVSKDENTPFYSQLLNFNPNNCLSGGSNTAPLPIPQGSIDYELPLNCGDAKVKLHLDTNYSQATQSFDQFATKNDESFIVNGRLSVLDIGVGGSKLNLGLWSRNIFNTQYVYRRDPSNSIPSVQTRAVAGVPNVLLIGSTSGILGDYGNFNMPRTFGLDASLSF